MRMKRENSLDLMRVIAACSIVFFHSAGNLNTKFALGSDMSGAEMTTVLGLTFIAKAAVVLFLLVSGAFTLSSSALSDVRGHYRKTWKKLGIPTLIFSLVYLAQTFAVWMEGIREGIDRFLYEPKEIASELLKMLLKGETASHLWYLYLLIALYLMAPFLRKLLDMIGDHQLLLSVILILWGWVSHMTADHYLTWDLGYAAENTGIFMLGYVLHEKEKKSDAIRGAGHVFLFALILLFIHAAGFILFRSNAVLSVIFVPDTLSGLTALESGLIFVGFMRLRISHDFGMPSSLTYGVYLIHPLVGSLVAAVWAGIMGISYFSVGDTVGTVFLYGAIICILSFIAVWLWKRLRRHFGRKREA